MITHFIRLIETKTSCEHTFTSSFLLAFIMVLFLRVEIRGRLYLRSKTSFGVLKYLAGSNFFAKTYVDIKYLQ